MSVGWRPTNPTKASFAVRAVEASAWAKTNVNPGEITRGDLEKSRLCALAGLASAS